MTDVAETINAISQLAGKLYSLGAQYIEGTARAPDELRSLVNELHSLGNVLVILREFAAADPTSKALELLNGPLPECYWDLEDLREWLVPGIWREGNLDTLEWPLGEDETLQRVVQMGRHKTLFSLAVTKDHLLLAKTIDRYFQRTWAVVPDIQDCVRSSPKQKEQDTQTAEHRNTVLNWLSPEDPHITHASISSKRQNNTGNWLMESPEFLGWEKGQLGSRLLWGRGIPGAGKTFLSSAVIDYLKARSPTGYSVAYIYFDHHEPTLQTPPHVLSSLLKQLSRLSPGLPSSLSNLHTRLEREKRRPTFEDLCAALLGAACSKRVFFVFNALDECVEPKQAELLRLFGWMAGHDFSVFLTSRSTSSISATLCGMPVIELRPRAEDLAKYIRDRIKRDPRARGFVRRDGCRDRIIAGLLDSAVGMFLLVRLHMQYICEQRSAGGVIRVLDELRQPSAAERPLDAAYHRAIAQIRRQPAVSVELALNVLSWLAKSQRKLRVSEILTAVSVVPGRYNLTGIVLPNVATLVAVCAGLVVVDACSGTIRLVHATVRGFLLKHAVLPVDADVRLAFACVTYLSFDTLARGACGSAEQMAERVETNPFLTYAAVYLAAHLEVCPEERTTDVVLHFLRSTGAIESYLQAANIKRQRLGIEIDNYSQGVHALHIAAGIGHVGACRALLKQDAQSVGGRGIMTVSDRKGRLALHVAAWKGHVAVVELLLENGAELAAAGLGGETPLHWATQEGHTAVVGLLLEKGADCSSRSHLGSTPLHWAAAEGQTAVVGQLLENGAECSAVGKDGQTPLHQAASLGHTAVVGLLLEKGADYSACTRFRDTPLHKAAYSGHLDVVRLLLEAGADPLAPARFGQTPLHLAASEGHIAVVSLLLEKGADYSASARFGQTPLHLAASEGHIAVVSLLLEKGANHSASERAGQTPLSGASDAGHAAVVSLLLEKGAANSAEINGRTPLHRAAYLGHTMVVRLLLESGADYLAIEKNGYTPLHWAAYSGHIEAANMLLEKGADPSASAIFGQTPLHLAASTGCTAMVKLLLEKGADHSSSEEGGQTALHWAASVGHEAVVALLLAKGSVIAD